MITYLVGESEKIKNVTSLIFKIADAPINILINGDSGTGKELAARMIHINSSRNSKPFIDLNCAALPDSLLEAELFGIEKGVATGVEKRTGKIEMSDGGTLFLDEIGDMSLSAQAKLLRVLQEKMIQRLGGKDNIEIDLRVIAATNKDLLEEIKKGNFREDLYYRLNEVNIKMPSLKDLKEDIQTLAQYFLESYREELNDVKPEGFSQKAVEYLRNYEWPGNIRELKSEIKRLAIIATGPEIDEDELSAPIKDFIRGDCQSVAHSIDDEKPLKEMVEDLEISAIKKALEHTRGNKLQASKKLGITRQGLLNKIKKYRLEEDMGEGSVRSISDHIADSEKDKFVGRRDYIDKIKKIILADKLNYYVLFLHGIGGIGKTQLVKEVLREIDDKARSYYMDCREIEPTERGFISQLSKKLGLKESSRLDDITDKLGIEKNRVVIVLDTFEIFGLLDTWLRKTFIPSMPENIVTVIISRQPPNSAWLTSEGLGVFIKEMEIGELSYSEVQQFLKTKNLTNDLTEKIYSIVHGHPLALELATRALNNNPDLKLSYINFPELIKDLTSEFIDGLTPGLQKTVESVSVLRRFDEPLLQELLSNDYEKELVYQLSQLPLVAMSAEGYYVHDIVRETLSKNLFLINPEKYRELKKTAWLHIINRINKNDRDELWKSTADLLYLIENPVVRDAFFPRGFMNLAVEFAGQDDGSKILSLTEQTEPDEATGLIRLWWNKYPNSFKVVKNFMNEIVGYFILSEVQELDPKILNNDPVSQTWFEDLESNPINSGEKALFLRRWISKDYGEMPCLPQAASWLDVKRNYMELRPNLKRLYTTVIDLDTWGPVVTPLGFKLLEHGEDVIGDLKYYSAVLDFGPESVDGWLKKLIGIELGVDNLSAS